MKEKIKGLLAGIIFRLIALLTLGQISPILSACVIVEKDGKILLVDRSDGLGYTIPGELYVIKKHLKSVSVGKLMRRQAMMLGLQD
ncbi:hypothetical protein KDW_07860 [Dictyobacter vulcani]|uniref:Nudix hydrolase domain-containing protein n=1 Tax=Dictyobacter vulcani TaxID=2607529 RepID=A0A5J4KCK8_9CHLR|nr:hypothetical protein [Dictyobacter vulcani]GER86624.1 hypothetical protein KDW_07860 [Dictyobacter vulcani]